jgi:hypothetical protein
MFHLRRCLLNKGAAPCERFPVLAPTTMATRRNQLNSHLEQKGLGPRHRTSPELSTGSGDGFERCAYPLPACCLLIACSWVLITILILSEMRLDYSSVRVGFAYKTTEQLWHSRALLRCIVCRDDDAVLVAVCVHFESVFRQLREDVHAQVAQAGAATRAGCAHLSGSVG